MRSNRYWQGRFLQLEDALNNKAENFMYDSEAHFKKAQIEIQREIESWYQRAAANNKISVNEAYALLSKKELEEFHWSVEEYIRYGEENAVDGRWMQELENASARYHITKLEALKVHTQQYAELLFGNLTDGIDSIMRDTYTEGYYHTAFEIQKGIGIGWDIQSVNENQLNMIISKPWGVDEKNFSERIWGHKTKLIHTLHSELTQMAILGKGPEAAVENIAQALGVQKSAAKRLVMTERAYFAAVAQEDCYRVLNVGEYEVVATLDSHTSEICRDMDGKVFPLDVYSPGVTAPPFHPWCRSCTIPSFKDDFGERAARDQEGKVYYAPGNINYREWEGQFVNGQSGNKYSKISVWEGVSDALPYTKQEAVGRLKSEYGIDFSDSHRYPINEEVLSNCVNWLDSFSNSFSVFMEKNPCKIPIIKNQAPSYMKGAVGYYSYYMNNAGVVELALNARHHSNPEFFKKYIQDAVDKNWLSRNTDLNRTFIHEFGHHVSNSMKHSTGDSSWQHTFLQECFEEFNENYGKDIKGYWQVSEYVSQYGASSEGELFAESFAEYFGSGDARDFSKVFGEKLTEKLKEVK